jgi:hypothetical protein
MDRSFGEHQAIRVAKHIRNYYRGSFYIDQSGPFYFDAGRACVDDVNNVRWKKFLAQINKEIKNMTTLKLTASN